MSSLYKSIKEMCAQAGETRDYKVIKGGNKLPRDEFGKLVWWIDLKHGKKDAERRATYREGDDGE